MSDTPLDLAPIRARLEAATPGDWKASWDISWTPRVLADGGCIADVGSNEDATLMAAAPSDITALIAEVERLRDVEAGLRRGLDVAEKSCCDGCHDGCSDMDWTCAGCRGRGAR